MLANRSIHRQLPVHSFKGAVGLVFLRENRLTCRPENSQIRIVPQDAMVIVRRIIRRALIQERCRLAGDTKSMSASGRDVHLVKVLTREFDPIPFPERRGSLSNVD